MRSDGGMVDTLSGEYQTLTGSLEAAVRPMAHMPGRTVHSPSADPMTDRRLGSWQIWCRVRWISGAGSGTLSGRKF